ncbi:MAG TPA: glycosyltransferase [Gaiellaceae bacterium]|nr:glycosyltransferase [Gaiellaceae bacterium]
MRHDIGANEPPGTRAPATSRPALRVMTLVDSISIGGGAERFAAEVTLRLDSTRFERTICATRPRTDESYLQKFAADGVRVIRLERRGKRDLLAWRPLIPELRRTDVLHAHKFGSNVWGVLLGRMTGVPVIVAHEHTWSFQGQPLRRALDRELIARGSDAFLFVSREDRRRAHDIEHIDPSRTRYLPNGVPRLVPTGYDIRSELGIGVEAPVVVTVAALRPQKALHRLISAAAVWRQDHPGITVLLVGGGAEYERLRLQALAETLGVADVVRFLGRRGDVADILAAADVTVCCSDYEGLPLSVMEYMGAGKAVVATAVGGVPDLIEDGVHGVLIEPGDDGALVAAVDGLLRDEGWRARLGAAARARQESEFAIESVVNRIEDLYDELHAARRR